MLRLSRFYVRSGICDRPRVLRPLRSVGRSHEKNDMISTRARKCSLYEQDHEQICAGSPRSLSFACEQLCRVVADDPRRTQAARVERRVFLLININIPDLYENPAKTIFRPLRGRSDEGRSQKS